MPLPLAPARRAPSPHPIAPWLHPRCAAPAPVFLDPPSVRLPWRRHWPLPRRTVASKSRLFPLAANSAPSPPSPAPHSPGFSPRWPAPTPNPRFVPAHKSLVPALGPPARLATGHQRWNFRWPHFPWHAARLLPPIPLHSPPAPATLSPDPTPPDNSPYRPSLPPVRLPPP